MPVNYEKYELILKKLASGKTWRVVVSEMSCSRSTIVKAVAWDLEGKPITSKKVSKPKRRQLWEIFRDISKENSGVEIFNYD